MTRKPTQTEWDILVSYLHRRYIDQNAVRCDSCDGNGQDSAFLGVDDTWPLRPMVCFECLGVGIKLLLNERELLNKRLTFRYEDAPTKYPWAVSLLKDLVKSTDAPDQETL
jgi:hypothetical protein